MATQTASICIVDACDHPGTPFKQAHPENFVSLDASFVALVDGAFADAARRSGPHLLCKPGCHSCCVGVFGVGPADALRLERGLRSLEQENPARATAVKQRANASWARLRGSFPGDPLTGILRQDSADEDFSDYGNEEPCPALDPATGTCDLYASRPHTCRVYGPPVRTPEGYGVCELCFTHATGAEVTAGAIAPEPSGVATALDQAAIEQGALPGETIIAWVLRSFSAPRTCQHTPSNGR